jgi:hypothetical protein
MGYAGVLIWYNGTSVLIRLLSPKAEGIACWISKVNIPDALQDFEYAFVTITCRCPKIHYFHEQGACKIHV